ncbi:hypothetical protein GA0061078_0573 [Bifidobacterium bohemicum]|uniref:Uncharacterized protein n=1 Tax=Bifidobacterium bohemicum DSM 22767 TaxID=1437606 RepID=A0A086ZJW9_9BIFI|nr:hypothetical protein [Bifidobacterium bohemicum]KFI46819.1 hypothetical protein BBOH_0293 [Bifidobacterium bohemicum DSM 22767]SCB82225.1 hypothetical protein GA0061078_0573 [Bifidobacterium bohemicum]
MEKSSEILNSLQANENVIDLEDQDDLWYFIKGGGNWIMGS